VVAVAAGAAGVGVAVSPPHADNTMERTISIDANNAIFRDFIVSFLRFGLCFINLMSRSQPNIARQPPPLIGNSPATYHVRRRLRA
jgi:hypothetical protein